MGSKPPGGTVRWLGPLAGLLVAAGGVVALLPHGTGHPPRSVAVGCGLVTCTATLPVSVTGPAAPSASPSARPPSAATTASPGPSAVGQAADPATPLAVPVTAASPVSASPPAPAAWASGPDAISRWLQGIESQFLTGNHGLRPGYPLGPGGHFPR